MKTTIENHNVSEDMNVVNNTLLAEFLGWEVDKDPNQINPSDILYVSSTGLKTPYQTVYVKDMEFHSDWNWLMEVVDKIESLGMLFKVSRWREDEVLTNGYWCTISDSFSGVEFADSAYINDTETRIEAMYLACIEFIKWYNLQNS